MTFIVRANLWALPFGILPFDGTVPRAAGNDSDLTACAARSSGATVG